MKKIHLLTVAAIAALTVACNGGGVNTNVKLATGIDTLSYAYGVELTEKGLTQYLAQAGIISDTNQVRFTYTHLIQAETDPAKQAKLQKEVETKIDSLAKANKSNLTDFLSGLKEGYNANDKKNSYMKGIEIGNQLKQMADNMAKQVYGEDSKEKINKDALLAGVVATLKKEKIAVENAGAIVEIKMRDLQRKLAEKEHAENIAAGKKFLEENKSKEGVVTLPNGLQYKVITEGNGEKPTASNRVKVHYHGTLADGSVFDSSVNRGEPVDFGVGEVIPGWTQILQLMPVGSKWTVFIPADLAYGDRDTGSIPPFSTLIFDIELLGIEK